MPEANAIGRIDRRHGVIAPAPSGVKLCAAAISHYGFALPEIIQWIAGETSGITDRGIYARAGCGIADMAVFPF